MVDQIRLSRVVPTVRIVAGMVATAAAIVATLVATTAVVSHKWVQRRSDYDSQQYNSASSYPHNCAPHPDLVTGIPGYRDYHRPLPSMTSCWYSGYVHYDFEGQHVHTHYTLVTAEQIKTTKQGRIQDNENDEVDTRPLIYWSNGGPGASSLYGLLTELGPLLLSDDSLGSETGIPTPIYNPYAWTQLGHVLTFDQPAPVGFSYCNSRQDDMLHPHSCGGLTWTDERTAQSAHLALRSFYDLHPTYQSIDLYLTGESYAGIYIPTLAREIVRHNGNTNTARGAAVTTTRGDDFFDQHDDDSDNNSNFTIPLVGFAVGDGCLGIGTGICGNINNNSTNPNFNLWDLVFLAGHGQIPIQTFVETMQACHADHWPPTFLDGSSSHKVDVAAHLQGLLTTTAAAAATTTTTTTAESTVSTPGSSAQQKTVDDTACQAALDKVTEQAGGVFAYGLYDDCTYSNGLSKTFRSTSLSGGLNDYPCGGGLVMEQYLALPVVRAAFHVQDSAFFSVDNAEGDFDYVPTEVDLSSFYQEMNGKLRILVYNGDTDPAINSFAAQNWTSHLGLTEEQAWRPWTVDGCRRMGGYVTRYKGNFDFLTIRGAGHMVPTHKAAAAFTFMKAWIEGTDYPTYDKDCLEPSSLSHFAPHATTTSTA